MGRLCFCRIPGDEGNPRRDVAVVAERADNIGQSPPPFAPIEQPEGEARREDARGKARPGDEARRSGNPEPSFGSSETRLCTGKKQPAARGNWCQ